MMVYRILSMRKRRSRYIFKPLPDIMEDSLDTSIATETTDREEEIMMRSNSLGLHASVVREPRI